MSPPAPPGAKPPAAKQPKPRARKSTGNEGQLNVSPIPTFFAFVRTNEPSNGSLTYADRRRRTEAEESKTDTNARAGTSKPASQIMCHHLAACPTVQLLVRLFILRPSLSECTWIAAGVAHISSTIKKKKKRNHRLNTTYYRWWVETGAPC